VRLLFLRLISVGVTAMTVGSAAFAGGLDATTIAAYANLSLSPPSTSAIIVCHGFGCRIHTEIGLGAGDRARLAQIFSGAKGSAAAERAAIATAGQWFDRRIGPATGTTHHIARAGYEHFTEAKNQFDCIDTSRNTTTLLLLLDQLKLLKFHRIEQTVARGGFLDGRWPHATAVITDTKTQVKWAVDPWVHPAGEKPDVKPLETWLQEN
jgi:hypothetical protein